MIFVLTLNRFLDQNFNQLTPFLIHLITRWCCLCFDSIAVVVVDDVLLYTYLFLSFPLI